MCPLDTPPDKSGRFSGYACPIELRWRLRVLPESTRTASAREGRRPGGRMKCDRTARHSRPRGWAIHPPLQSRAFWPASVQVCAEEPISLGRVAAARLLSIIAMGRLLSPVARSTWGVAPNCRSLYECSTCGFGVCFHLSIGVHSRLSMPKFPPHFCQSVHSCPYLCAQVGVRVGVTAFHSRNSATWSHPSSF